MALTPLLNPIADLKLSFAVDPITGTLTVDFVLTPSGDLATVTGIQRLIQDVTIWLLTPKGARPLDPTFGNPLFQLVGRPQTVDPDIFAAMILQCQSDFIGRQQAIAAQGYLSLDEQVDHFENLTINIGGSQQNPALASTSAQAGPQLPPGMVLITFTVVSRSGYAGQVIVPYTISVGV